MQSNEKLSQTTIDKLAFYLAREVTLRTFDGIKLTAHEPAAQFFFEHLDKFLVALTSTNDSRESPGAEMITDPFANW